VITSQGFTPGEKKSPVGGIQFGRRGDVMNWRGEGGGGRIQADLQWRRHFQSKGLEETSQKILPYSPESG